MGITDLPTELLLHIGDFVLQIDSPYYHSLSLLAQTCRRLYDAFVPQIDTYHVNILRNLRITLEKCPADETPAAFLRGRFKELAFDMENQPFVNMQCTRYLVPRASSIRKITVNVEYRQTLYRHRQTDPAVVYLPAFYILVRLLNSCVQRPQLRLEINGNSRNEEGPFVFKFDITRQKRDVHSEQSSPKLPMVLTKLRTLFSWIKEKETTESEEESDNMSEPSYIVTRRPAQRSQLPYPRFPPLLTTLCIRGEFLFSASMYPWTLYILNTAPLIHLSVTDGRSNPNHFTWSQILPAITIPTLKELAIGKIAVAFPDMVDFLKRHPSLQSLDLTANYLIGVFRFPDSLSKSEFLPRLCRLTASSEYTTPFIRYHQLGYCPQLKTYKFVPFPDGSYR